MKYSNEELMKYYEEMVLGREYELYVEEALKAGKMQGLWHLALGQEAQIGMWHALGEKDYMLPHYRCNPAIINVMDIQKITNEMVGNEEGYFKGKANLPHWGSLENRILPLNGILSAQVAIAVGYALSLKMDGSDSVVVVGMGDGSTKEGIVYEAMNMAAIWDLKMVFYIENNGYGLSTPISYASKVEDLYKIGDAVGIPGCKCNGNDILVVKETMEEAIEKARNGQPNIIEYKTYRYRGHYVGDPATYRDPKELEDAKANNDPLDNMEKVLLEKGIAAAGDFERIHVEKRKRVIEVFDHALAIKQASPEEILDISKVYAK